MNEAPRLRDINQLTNVSNEFADIRKEYFLWSFERETRSKLHLQGKHTTVSPGGTPMNLIHYSL